jgi:GntR family transcriptional regulator of arabinose operon
MENATGFHDRRMLYLQVRDYIVEQIEQGVFKSGELIPPERELAENLKISRYTVRRALQELVEEDILFRVQGSGTYVREKTNGLAKRVDSIGIVMPFCDAEIEMMLLSGMQKALRGTPYSMTLYTTDNDSAKEAEGIRRLREEGVAGLIIMPSTDQGGGQGTVPLKREGFPFVLVDRAIEGLQTNCVVSDNVQGGNQAARHLLDLGHSQIAFVSHKGDLSSSIHDRLTGFREAFKERGLPVGPTFTYDFETGVKDLKQFLIKRECTGLVVGNALVARDVVRACRELGLDIPEDFSIVSFDDLSIVKMLDVSLTTITQHTEAIGAKAVSLLIDQIENCDLEPGYLTQYYYPTRLIERDSCARLKGSKGR